MNRHRREILGIIAVLMHDPQPQFVRTVWILGRIQREHFSPTRLGKDSEKGGLFIIAIDQQIELPFTKV